MIDEKASVDINEAFESLLFAEEVAQNSAYTIGYEVGKTRLINGYHLGYHRAGTIAAQLGYYSGILEQYLHNTKNESTNKATTLAREVLQEIQGFPKHNDQTIDILKKFEEIKSRYARFCSFAKLNPSYPEAEKLDF